MPYRAEGSWDRWSPERIREEQGRRLSRFLREQVACFSPYYSQLLRDHGVDPGSIRSVDDLSRIPFTTKNDVAPTAETPDRPREFVVQPTADLIRTHWPITRKLSLLATRFLRGQDGVIQRLAQDYRPVSVFFTTGRSALPTAFALTRYDLDLLQEVGRRILQVARVDPATERLLNIFPFAPHLAFWQVYYAGVGGTVFTLNTGGGKVLGSSAILQAIEKIRPAYLAGIPGYMYHLLRRAHERSMDLSCIKGLALGGDQVTPGYRERARSMLESMGASRPRIVSVLGFTEARKCWTECSGEAHAGFHTYPDLEIMELIDPDTGKPVAEGETGELVYTSLDGRGSAVLRYRTGDLIVGGMTRAPCPHCGRTVPRLASQLQRVSNLQNFQLSKVKGTLVNLNLIKDLLDSDPRVEEWQVVIRKRNDDPFDVDEIHLHLSLSGGTGAAVDAAAKEALLAEIQQKLYQVSEIRMNSVRVLPLEELLDLLGMETQLKEKRIVDLRARVDGSTPAGGGGADSAEEAAEEVSSN